MKFGILASLLAAMALGLAACNTTNSTTGSASTGILYVATQGNTSVSAFGINLSNGAISTNGNLTATGNMPSSVVTAGGAAFVANTQDNSISSYTLNSDGTLAAGGTTKLSNATGPMGMAVDGSGKFLFVANQGSSNISVFSISTATLAEIAGSPFSTIDPNLNLPTGPVSVAVTSNASYLYVANQFTNSVSAFSVGASGALTPLFGNVTGATYVVGLSPGAVALTSDGNFLYVANQGSNTISAFAACTNAALTCVTPTGALSAVPGSPFAAGLGPISIAGSIDKLGEYLFVADYDSNQVSEYKISPGTGALAANTQATISTGSNPVSVVVRPGPGTVLTTGGVTNYVYVANKTSGTLSSYSYDTSIGTLSLVGSPLTVMGGQPSALAVR